ncbi:MAG: GtrA family protein [Candidatus Deferrimicrobiaceae bacterium]
MGRYTLVGGVAFLVDFSFLFVLTEFFRIQYLVSAALSFLTGLSVNYLLSISWVFSRRRVGSRFAEFGTFALIGVVGLFFNELFIWFFTEKVLFHYLVSKCFSAVLVYLWNFTARKIALFR